MLKQIADIISPFIIELFDRSLCKGLFPATFKEASITPVLKKPGLDATSVSSYRPISNLSVLSKLLECLVARQLMEYLSLADLVLPLQSGFRQGHFTETAVLRVLADILQAVDRGDLAALVVLGPILCVLYTFDLLRVIDSYGCRQHAGLWILLTDRGNRTHSEYHRPH